MLELIPLLLSAPKRLSNLTYVPLTQTDAGVLIKAVVDYIRTLVNIDDLEALGTEIFGSSGDPRVAKLKQVNTSDLT